MSFNSGLTTSVPITCIERIPPPKTTHIACNKCGWECARWQRRETPDGPRKSGVLLLIAHQLAVHSGDEVTA